MSLFSEVFIVFEVLKGSHEQSTTLLQLYIRLKEDIIPTRTRCPLCNSGTEKRKLY